MERVPQEQEGVVSRRQLLASGVSSEQIERMLRRRQLMAVHPGVYLSHTGEPTWRERAWAALLVLDPCWGVPVAGGEPEAGRAALAGASALRIGLGPSTFVGPNLRSALTSDLVHVAVGRDRRREPSNGVRLHRTEHLLDRTVWSLSPPRLRAEEALLDLVLESDRPQRALGLLADACQARLTTAERVRRCLDARQRVPGRGLLAGVLDDIAQGTCSVLEHGYLHRVVRPHGLPTPQQQVREASTLGLVFRDGMSGRLVVELDGRFFHDNARQRDRDFDRDLDVAAMGRGTVRLTWGQVFDRPCATAHRLAQVLQRYGWSGVATRCGPACGLTP